VKRDRSHKRRERGWGRDTDSLATTKEQTSRRLLRPPTTSAGGNFRNATIVLGVSVQTDPDREVELDVSSHGGQCLTPSSRGAKYLRRNCKPTQPADMGGHSWLSVHSRDSNHLGFCSQEKDLPVLQRPRALADSTPVKHRQKECVSEVDSQRKQILRTLQSMWPRSIVRYAVDDYRS
jgi:hypothetical protein